MGPTLLLPSAHLGLSGGFAFNADVGGGWQGLLSCDLSPDSTL